MNFVPYVFKKDFIRLKLILLVWLLLIVGQSTLGMGGMKIAADTFEFQMILPMLTWLLNALQGMLILVLVPLVIHEDAFVGTTAFWFTRPISRKAMLVTKLVFIFLLLVALPLAAELTVLAANGVNGHHVLLAVPEILLEKIAYITPFLLLAVLTPKISRYALVGVGIFAGYMLFSVVMYVVAIFIPGFGKFMYNYDLYHQPSLEASMRVAKDIYIIVLGMALVVHQCITRRTRRTVLWCIVAYLLLIPFSQFWSIDFMRVTSSAAAQAAISDSLQLTIDTRHTIINEEMRYRKEDAREKSISVKATVIGLPREQFANLRKLGKARIEFQSGITVKSEYVSPRTLQSASHEKYMSAIQAALGTPRVVNPFYGEFTYTEILSLKDVDMIAHKDKTGTYAAEASFDVYRYQRVTELPLAPGARAEFSSQQVIVYDVLENAQGVSVIVGEKKTNLLFDRSVKKKSRYDLSRDMYSNFKTVYVLVNPNRGEAFLAESGGNLDFDMSAAYGQQRLQTRAKQFDFTHVTDRQPNLPKIDKEWLAGAQLVRLDAVRLGTKKVAVNIENFRIPTQTTSVANQRDEMDQQLREQEKQMQRMGMPE